MTADPRLTEAFARLPDYLGGHVLVSVTALALGLGISLPLAIASRQRRRCADRAARRSPASCRRSRAWRCSRCSIRCCSALAALCERLFGTGFSALGFLPSVLALTLYSMLPVLRNTVTGLHGIDPAIARGGARRRHDAAASAVRMVELPLALPVIMAGIRTAAVWVIGAATLSTPIGQTSLGNYIFTGLQTQNWVFVLFGCVAAAVLALVVDQLLALMEHGRRRAAAARVVVAGGVGLVLVVLAALRAGAWPRAARTYAIGAKPFTEQYVLAALIEQRLADAGLIAREPRRARLRRHLQCARAPARSTPMSTIPARSGPTRCTAATSSRAPRCWPR